MHQGVEFVSATRRFGDPPPDNSSRWPTTRGETAAVISYAVRVPIDLEQLQRLFVAAWDGVPKPHYDRVLSCSFTWVTAMDDDELVGFVNVAWDGGIHFFMLDTTVHPSRQRQGIGSQLVRRALAACQGHGEWMHVDSDDELMEHLYFANGFQPANAGTACLLT